ncbi:MAG: hypothetical protein LRS49_03290 [Desulfurococcales archaeon]|nr:hypothetical protein [Desulfurococcales archaeon]
MSGGELEAKLRLHLGLSGYEARAYLALLRLGRAQAREVAEESGVPQQRIYDVLRRLARRGLAVEERGTWRPLPPGEALRAEAERRLLEARKAAAALEELARELEQAARGPGAEGVTLIHGLEDALAWAAAAAARCGERPVFTAYKSVERLGELWPLLRGLVESLPHGALVLVPEDAEIPGDLAEEAGGLGVEVRRAPCIILDLMVACDTTIIGLPGPGGGVVGVVVRSVEFSEALRRRLLGLAGLHV